MNRLFGIYRWGISLFIVIAGLLFSGSIYGAAAAPEGKAQFGGEYRVPVESEPVTLDPASYSDIYAMTVASNIFDGLVEYDKDLNVVPAISSKWKISRDHRSYTFQLRKGIKFHNGREVVAEDFVYSFSRLLNPEIKSPAASLFLNIQGAKAFQEGKADKITGLSAVDPYTLKIELEEPFAPFLSILANVNAKVVPKEAVDGNFGKNPVGTGPFRFRNWEPGKEISLEANAEYFAGRPYLDMLRFSIYPNVDFEKVFADFEKGVLEQSFIPTNKYDLVASKQNHQNRYSFISMPGINLVYVGMNMTMEPFNDLRVRQAFNYAVDTEKIVKEITRRGNIEAKGILPPGIAGFDPHFDGYSYDPQKARSLLKEAGYPDGKGIPPLEIWTVSKAESVQNELKAYQKYLADIGVQVIPKVAENWKEFIGLINEKKVPLFYAAWYADFPDPDNFLYVLCYSQSKTNRMGYKNDQVDKLLDEARKEMDYMKRVELYRKIEKLVMEDAPLITQHVNSFNYFFQPWVQGVELGHLGGIYIPFRKVWIDHRSLAAAPESGQAPEKVEKVVATVQ